jgi:hypothetical protein
VRELQGFLDATGTRRLPDPPLQSRFSDWGTEEDSEQPDGSLADVQDDNGELDDQLNGQEGDSNDDQQHITAGVQAAGETKPVNGGNAVPATSGTTAAGGKESQGSSSQNVDSGASSNRDSIELTVTPATTTSDIPPGPPAPNALQADAERLRSFALCLLLVFFFVVGDFCVRLLAVALFVFFHFPGSARQVAFRAGVFYRALCTEYLVPDVTAPEDLEDTCPTFVQVRNRTRAITQFCFDPEDGMGLILESICTILSILALHWISETSFGYACMKFIPLSLGIAALALPRETGITLGASARGFVEGWKEGTGGTDAGGTGGTTVREHVLGGLALSTYIVFVLIPYFRSIA